MEYATIEDLVRKCLSFSSSSTTGWNKIYCEVCGDGEGRTKGPRGGWLFNGEQAFYHCFNCNCEGSFDPEREFPYGKDMWKILAAFGIPKEEHQSIAYKNRGKNSITFTKPVKKEIQVEAIPVPDHFYKLSDASDNNIIARKAIDFLWNEKRIKPADYEFYLSTGISKDGPRENAIARSLIGKIIIPYFKDGKMIYYQGRALDKKLFINASSSRTAVIYGYDKLRKDNNKPLYITEGFWDAFHLDGVAVLENKLTTTQIEVLNRCPRRKIVVPDKKDDSKKLASQAVELGWEISLPEIGNEDDITKGILKYGKIYVLNSVNNQIFSGFQASINLEIY